MSDHYDCINCGGHLGIDYGDCRNCTPSKFLYWDEKFKSRGRYLSDMEFLLNNYDEYFEAVSEFNKKCPKSIDKKCVYTKENLEKLLAEYKGLEKEFMEMEKLYYDKKHLRGM